MREILSHGPGKTFAAFLALTVVALFAVTPIFGKGIVLFGWIPLPFAVGLAMVLLWLGACALYLFRHWPYR